MTGDATLSAPEIQKLTGYAQPARQLHELHRQGFYRARRSPTTGVVILERAHYDAVCAGARQESTPRVRPPQLKAA